MCHVHVPGAKRTNLKNRSTSGVFLGINDESKGYRIYDPMIKKIMTSKDVVFEEKRKWDWGMHYEQ